MSTTLKQEDTTTLANLGAELKPVVWTTDAGVKQLVNEVTPLPVTMGAAPTGSATAGKQDTGNTSLASIDTNVAKQIPATTAAAVTPSDSTALTSRAVWVGGAGDLSVRLSGATSTTVVFTAVPAGTLLPLSVVRIMAATTATNINVLA